MVLPFAQDPFQNLTPHPGNGWSEVPSRPWPQSSERSLWPTTPHLQALVGELQAPGGEVAGVGHGGPTGEGGQGRAGDVLHQQHGPEGGTPMHRGGGGPVGGAELRRKKTAPKTLSDSPAILTNEVTPLRRSASLLLPHKRGSRDWAPALHLASASVGPNPLLGRLPRSGIGRGRSPAGPGGGGRWRAGRGRCPRCAPRGRRPGWSTSGTAAGTAGPRRAEGRRPAAPVCRGRARPGHSGRPATECRRAARPGHRPGRGGRERGAGGMGAASPGLTGGKRCSGMNAVNVSLRPSPS